MEELTKFGSLFYLYRFGWLFKIVQCPICGDFLTRLREHRCEGFYKKSSF